MLRVRIIDECHRLENGKYHRRPRQEKYSQSQEVEEENVELVGKQRGEYYIQSPISEMKINCNHHLLVVLYICRRAAPLVS